MTDAFPQLDGVEHRMVELPGLRMHVAEAGHGEPVLFLHGFTQHWWEWRKVVPGLAERYRLVCPDLRGAGWTDAPRSGYTAPQLLADVVALLDELRIDRVHLVGHDWGAVVGFRLCLSHPDRVRSYLCLATPHPFVRLDPRALSAAWRLWFQIVIAAPVLGPLLLRTGDQPFARYLLRSFSYNRDAWSDEDVELFVAPLRNPSRAHAGSALYRRFVLPEVFRIMRGAYRTGRLETPTRLLVGAQDPVTRPELLGGYEDHADDLTVNVVDGASHFIADENPDAVVAHALELFAQH